MSRLTKSTPIKWHGGKTYLAERIIALMPSHTHYVEPFFGGGAVLFRKPHDVVEGHSEVINDRLGELVNFWKVLQSRSNFKEFQRRLLLTPFSQQLWNESTQQGKTDSVQWACDFFVKYRQSRQGLGRCFATMSRTRTRRGMNEQVSSWLSAVEGLEEAHERLRRVVILCDDAVSVIKREDDRESLFYCDPPYVSSTRSVDNAYSCEMTDAHHEMLLATLSELQGMFILSGYRCALYDDFAETAGWRRVDIQIDNKASSKKVKPLKTESLWFNF